jgi:hypothetical protein
LQAFSLIFLAVPRFSTLSGLGNPTPSIRDRPCRAAFPGRFGNLFFRRKQVYAPPLQLPPHRLFPEFPHALRIFDNIARRFANAPLRQRSRPLLGRTSGRRLTQSGHSRRCTDSILPLNFPCYSLGIPCSRSLGGPCQPALRHAPSNARKAIRVASPARGISRLIPCVIGLSGARPPSTPNPLSGRQPQALIVSANHFPGQKTGSIRLFGSPDGIAASESPPPAPPSPWPYADWRNKPDRLAGAPIAKTSPASKLRTLSLRRPRSSRASRRTPRGNWPIPTFQGPAALPDGNRTGYRPTIFEPKGHLNARAFRNA